MTELVYFLAFLGATTFYVCFAVGAMIFWDRVQLHRFRSVRRDELEELRGMLRYGRRCDV